MTHASLRINEPLGRKLRMALIGGGGNAFIGKVHAVAATLDGRAELVAGALSSDDAKARGAGAEFGIAPERSYGSYRELLQAEAARDSGDRVDFVSIATPNYTHYPMAMEALEHGFHVVCEKPLTTNVHDARRLLARVESSGKVFALVHNYSGYPMVRQARDMIAAGELGEVQAVRVNYIQGGLRGLVPGQVPARGAWKSDPGKAGPAGTLADIGSHAYHLLRFVSGLQPEEISCTLRTYHPSRQLDDYGHALIRGAHGTLAMITFSQVTHGRLNDLSLEIDGSQASLAWRQEEPNQLVMRRFNYPIQIYERHPAATYASTGMRAASRLPAGHPEAFYEAFANLFRYAYDDMVAHATHASLTRTPLYPNAYEGLLTVFFVEQSLASHAQRGAWLSLRDEQARGDL